jgi:DNA-binding SARP family transcriptional activator
VVQVRPGKQRALLAALLLAAGRVAPLDELAEVLWGSQPPPSAGVTAQNYMVRLRKALGSPGRARISSQPGGYMICVEGGELDAARFEALLRAARAAARGGSWDQAARDASCERAVSAVARRALEPLRVDLAVPYIFRLSRRGNAVLVRFS